MLQGEIWVFYLTFVLLEAIYLPVLKSFVHISTLQAVTTLGYLIRKIVAKQVVSFAAIISDVTQCSPPHNSFQ